MASNEEMISQTRKWVIDVVIGANFCPFAAQVVKGNAIHYQVAAAGGVKASVEAFIQECDYLELHPEIETTLLLFPFQFEVFDHYLDLVDAAERMLAKKGFEGVYQLASFHPDYLFAGADSQDAENYTNRSIFPMLHILRESSIEKALEKYADPQGIPERNMDFARKKGLAYMKLLREQCMLP